MSGQGDDKRTISAHRLPVSLPLPRTRPARDDQPQAAFLTQLLTASPIAARPRAGDPNANSAYRSVEGSDVKRMPAGYRKTLSA